MKSKMTVFAGLFLALTAQVHALTSNSVRFDARTSFGGRLATEVELLGSSDGSSLDAWDTTAEQDGWQTLGSGNSSVDVCVLNTTATVHEGRLASDETWSVGVHVVRSNVVVPSGMSLTLASGAVVKFTEGASIIEEGSGAVVFQGVQCADIADDGIGGDTNFDSSDSSPTTVASDWFSEGVSANIVSFVSESGDVELIRYYSSGITLGTLPTPTKDGYTFLGWFTMKEGGAQVTADTVVTFDITLYVRWKEMVSQQESLSEALDLGMYAVTTGGDAEWFGQNYVTHDGVSAAQSGYISDRKTSHMEVVVKNVSSVSFWWKVSSEAHFDKLHFYVDGTEVVEPISGQSDWIKVEYQLSEGSHTLMWSYTKDFSTSNGYDCGWVDGVVWTPASTDITVDVGEGKSVVVPTEWIDRYEGIVSDAGGDKAASLMRTAANGRKVWECFMLGVDPTKADDDFKITRFWMEGGKPKFEFSHSTDGAGNSFVPRLKVKGKAELSDGWSDVPEGGNSTFRFFTVEVELQ